MQISGYYVIILAVGILPIKIYNAQEGNIMKDNCTKQGYKLIFSEEFDAPVLDTAKWTHTYFAHTASSEERSRATYEIKDSCLNLMIDETTPVYWDKEPMKVSSIQTFEKNLLHPGCGPDNINDVPEFHGFYTQYGYFEMRAKLPACGGGGHMAWWMIGIQDDANPDGTGSVRTGEIDIVESLYSNINNHRPSVHAWTDSKLQEFHEETLLDAKCDEEYHTYALDWREDGMDFIFDGKIISSTSLSPDYPMCMIIGMYTNCDWSGEDNGVYPKVFSVDYVRVYKKA